jgi:hypothetical protein
MVNQGHSYFFGIIMLDCLSVQKGLSLIVMNVHGFASVMIPQEDIQILNFLLLWIFLLSNKKALWTYNLPILVL